MTVTITLNDKGNPAGKLADAELHFTDGPLSGLKLIGFAIWERRGGAGRNVTFPARQYSIDGEAAASPSSAHCATPTRRIASVTWCSRPTPSTSAPPCSGLGRRVASAAHLLTPGSAS